MGIIIGSIFVGVTTLLLNIVLDYFILKDSDNLRLADVITNKSNEIIYLFAIIIEITLFILMGLSYIYYLYYFVVLIFYRIMIIDYKTKYIDNKLFVLMAIIAFVSLAINNNVPIVESIGTGIVAYVLFFLFSKATKGALGMGDANLFGLLGVIFGYQGLMGMLAVACILVFFVSAFLLIKNRANKNKELPFTPYIFTALIIMLIINNI